MEMTVSQLKTMLEALETTGAGNYRIEFCCKEKRKTNMDGTGTDVLPSRTFDFSDGKYEFKSYNYLTNNGAYPCKTTICTDNIEVDPLTETVRFYQF